MDCSALSRPAKADNQTEQGNICSVAYAGH